eukprot:Pgem_evm1s13791
MLEQKIQEANKLKRKKDENYRNLKKQLDKEQQNRLLGEQTLKKKLESKKVDEIQILKKHE